MQYNQPLDQPSNPNAPYVDGNPAAGIQGSIVPAASLEFDQREVVEVITRANVRGYSDFTNTLCAVPANTDMTQLRKAIEGYITNWQFLITTSVTFKVHGSGADFPDLIAAFAYLTKYRITSTGHVTLQLAGALSGIAVKYTYSQAVLMDHPNNNRISLLGAPMLASLVPNDSGYAWIGPSAPQRAADTATNLANLRSRFATELFFPGTAGGGFIIKGTMLADLDGILLTSDGAGSATGVNFNCNGYFNSSTTRPMMGLAAVGWSGAGFALDTGAAVSNYPSGSAASPVSNATWVSCGNYDGLVLGNGSFFCTVHNLIFLGNTSFGLQVWPGCGCQIDAAIFSNANGNIGVACYEAPTVYLAAGGWAGPTAFSHIYRNGGWGLTATQSNVSYVGDFGAAGYNNVSGSIQISANANVLVTGSTNIGACSPALGIVGNSDSLIST
jgi:hypothetical protein